MPSTGGYPFLMSEASVNPSGIPRLWYKNVGILDEINNPVLQPTRLVASVPGSAPVKSDMYVFFEPASDIGRMG